MIPQSLPELSEPLPSADQYLEHINDRAVDEAEAVLAALKHILENRIGTLEILHALVNPLASAEVIKATLPTLELVANKEPETKRNLYNVQPLSPTPPESEIGEALASVHFVPPLSFAELVAIEDRALKVPLHKLYLHPAFRALAGIPRPASQVWPPNGITTPNSHDSPTCA